jgi:hypothetical protein
MGITSPGKMMMNMIHNLLASTKQKLRVAHLEDSDHTGMCIDLEIKIGIWLQNGIINV